MVARLRSTQNLAADDYGTTAPDWVNAVASVDLVGALIAPVTRSEIYVGSVVGERAEGVPIGWTLYLPGTLAADITATDRIDYGGDIYLIDGDPSLWQRDGFGGLVISLTRFEG